MSEIIFYIWSLITFKGICITKSAFLFRANFSLSRFEEHCIKSWPFSAISYAYSFVTVGNGLVDEIEQNVGYTTLSCFEKKVLAKVDGRCWLEFCGNTQTCCLSWCFIVKCCSNLFYPAVKLQISCHLSSTTFNQFYRQWVCWMIMVATLHVCGSFNKELEPSKFNFCYQIFWLLKSLRSWLRHLENVSN